MYLYGGSPGHACRVCFSSLYAQQRLLHIRPQPRKRATRNNPHTALCSKPFGLGRCFWNRGRHGIIVTMTPSTTTTTLRLQPVPFCVDTVSAERRDRLIRHDDCAKHITAISKRPNLGHGLYAALEGYDIISRP